MKKILFILSLVAILPCFVWGQTNLTYYNTNTGTLGNYSCYFGDYSGLSATGTASYNSFFGQKSGQYLTTGTNNTFVGSEAGRKTTTGSYNSFFGVGSGWSNITGQQSVYLGYDAGYLSTGSYNIFIGSKAGYNNLGNYNVFIGHNAGFNEVGSNKLYIANSNTTTPLIYGDFSTNLININGKLGVGIASGDFTTFMAKNTKLGVNGTISATEVVVAAYANWPDFVFNADYKLNTLSEIETFVKANKHLPGVPSATEVEKEGVSLGEMNKVLLQKVEELTLHLIELEKKINQLENNTKNND
jgi:hypothetical protein